MSKQQGFFLIFHNNLSFFLFEMPALEILNLNTS